MKKTIFSIITLVLLFSLYGCPPNNRFPGIEKISNNSFDGKVHINKTVIYQEDKDVLVVRIENKNNYLKNFYISGKSIDIIEAKAFGSSLNKLVIDDKDYYEVDLKEFEEENYPSFLLELSFAKDSIFENQYYEEIVDHVIVAHSFDVFINYDKENNTGKFVNYRFYLDPYHDEYNNRQKIVVYNNLSEFFEHNDYYNGLYLPFSDGNNIKFSKEIVFYPNYDKCLFLKTRNMELKVWVDDIGIVYGGQEKSIYEKNGILYTIIKHENNRDFSIDFEVYETEKIQYSYQLYNTNITEVMDFIDSIQEYT